MSPYRYLLTRTNQPTFLKADAPRDVLVVMLNPSTADEHQDDPTIRRLIAWMRFEGWERVRVVNLFAWRATDPQLLVDAVGAVDIIGPENDHVTRAELLRADMVIAAWGTQTGPLAKLVRIRLEQLLAGPVADVERSLGRPIAWQCWGTTANGAPRHPLYVQGATPLRPWDPTEWAI